MARETQRSPCLLPDSTPAVCKVLSQKTNSVSIVRAAINIPTGKLTGLPIFCRICSEGGEETAQIFASGLQIFFQMFQATLLFRIFSHRVVWRVTGVGLLIRGITV